MNNTKCNILIFYFSKNYGFFLLKKILQDFAFKDMIKTKSLLPQYGCHDINDLAHQIEQRKKILIEWKKSYFVVINNYIKFI